MRTDRRCTAVEIPGHVTPEIVDAVSRLMSELTSHFAADASSIARLVSSDHAKLLVARDPQGEIVGTMTVAWHPTVAGLLARLETVVVDPGARRAGVASALLEEAERLAREAGAGGMEFWTGAGRDSAQAFYRARGYVSHPTVGFRKDLTVSAEAT
jgi:GNAT superfamily N-acetyltransferase